MKLYIIRHGQTDWNIAKKIQGRQDIPLNERGRYQAGCLKKAMENRPVTAVFSSPQIRAMETAKAVASSSGSVVIPVKDLMERDKAPAYRGCSNCSPWRFAGSFYGAAFRQ